MLPSGGGIRVARQFARGLSDHYRISEYRPDGGSPLNLSPCVEEVRIPFPMWRRPGGALRPVAPLFLIARLLAFRGVCRRAAAAMDKDADIALVHNTMPVAAPPILSFLNIPSLYFCYEYPRHIYEKDVILRTGSRAGELLLKPLEVLERRMDISAAASADIMATFSRYMRARVREIYRRDSEIVRPGVDTAFFKPDGRENEPRRNLVLSVGALWPFKGHETAIRAISLIPCEIRPELVIVADRGFPGYRQKLMDAAGRTSVRLSIAEAVTDEDVRHLYQTARAVLCCQRREPYGLIPLESMACGTPVVAINEGGFQDNIINGENGYLFDGSSEAAAAILSALVSNDDAWARTTANGLRFALEQRTIEHGINRLVEVLEKL
jgi:glycosyltransferase involved in cell wall biosynthesis